MKFALTLKLIGIWHSLISFAMIPDLLHTLSLHERRAEALALHSLKGENRKLWLPCVWSEFRFSLCLLLGDHTNFCRRVETLAYVKGPFSAWCLFDLKPGWAKSCWYVSHPCIRHRTLSCASAEFFMDVNACISLHSAATWGELKYFERSGLLRGVLGLLFSE